MSPFTTAKLALATAAAVLFGLGSRNDVAPLRWAAIGCLAMAVLLRFFDRNRGQR